MIHRRATFSRRGRSSVCLETGQWRRDRIATRWWQVKWNKALGKPNAPRSTEDVIFRSSTRDKRSENVSEENMTYVYWATTTLCNQTLSADVLKESSLDLGGNCYPTRAKSWNCLILNFLFCPCDSGFCSFYSLSVKKFKKKIIIGKIGPCATCVFETRMSSLIGT